MQHDEYLAEIESTRNYPQEMFKVRICLREVNSTEILGFVRDGGRGLFVAFFFLILNHSVL